MLLWRYIIMNEKIKLLQNELSHLQCRLIYEESAELDYNYEAVDNLQNQIKLKINELKELIKNERVYVIKYRYISPFYRDTNDRYLHPDDMYSDIIYVYDFKEAYEYAQELNKNHNDSVFWVEEYKGE